MLCLMQKPSHLKATRLINQFSKKNLQEKGCHLLRRCVLGRATKRWTLGLITVVDGVDSNEVLSLCFLYAFVSFQAARKEIIASQPDTLHRSSIKKTVFHQLDVDIWITEPRNALCGSTIIAGDDHPSHVTAKIVGKIHRSI